MVTSLGRDYLVECACVSTNGFRLFIYRLEWYLPTCWFVGSGCRLETHMASGRCRHDANRRTRRVQLALTVVAVAAAPKFCVCYISVRDAPLRRSHLSRVDGRPRLSNTTNDCHSTGTLHARPRPHTYRYMACGLHIAYRRGPSAVVYILVLWPLLTLEDRPSSMSYIPHSERAGDCKTFRTLCEPP